MTKKRTDKQKSIQTLKKNANSVKTTDSISETLDVTSHSDSGFFMRFLEKYGFIFGVVLSLVLYFKSFSYDYVNLDDYVLIVHYFERLSSFSKIVDEFFQIYMVGCWYRPLVTSSFIIDAQISGINPTAYHVTNFILHSIAVILVFYLFKQLNFKAFTSFSASLIFAVHPVFVNAVAWIVGRNDTLVAIFVMLSFLSFIKYAKNENILYIVLHFLFYFAAMLSKELSLTLPGLLVIFYFFTLRKKISNKRNIILVAGWTVLFVLWYLMRQKAFEDAWCGAELSFAFFIKNIATLPEFVSKFFLPINLSVLPVFTTFHTLFGLFFILALLALSFLKKGKRNSIITLGWVWFLFFTLPGMFSRLEIADHWNEYLECRTYLPLIGMMFIVAELIPNKISTFRNKYSIAGLALIIIVFFSSAWFEIDKYKGPGEFFSSAVADNPDKARIRYHYALHLNDIGKVEEAEKHLLKSIELNPEWGESFAMLGEIYFKQSNYERAIPLLEMSLDKFSINKASYFEASWKNLTLAYLNTNKYEPAKNLLGVILEMNDSDQFALASLQQIYMKEENMDLATKVTEKLFSQGVFNKNSAMIFNRLAVESIEKGKTKEAMRYWEASFSSGLTPSQTGWNLFKYFYTIEKNFPKAAYLADYLVSIGQSPSPQDIAFLATFKRDSSLFK